MPESVPAAIGNIDQLLQFVADVRNQGAALRVCPHCGTDPGEWLSDKLLEMRHAIVTLEAALVEA